MKTYNTIVKSKEVKTLENVISRCPYECVKLDENKYGFMDNENGDIRNYFCATLGYESSDFEYLEKPQTVEPSKPNFYTSNGCRGSKYDIKKGAKEVAKELRAYIKANPDLNACKWSIRSKWGMIADSLYISLMAAAFDPFTEEYKTRHEYRYERGYSEHGTVKDYTSPEAYKLMMKVKTFVIQYIHDDSDGMIDYYDRNIYDHYEIGQYDKPFKMIEKKENPKQDEPSSEPNGAKTSEPVAVLEGLEIVDYSGKAIAVFGETKAIKDELKALGGKFNPALKYNGEKCAGWIFSKKQADKVRELIAPAKNEEEADEIEKQDEKVFFSPELFAYELANKFGMSYYHNAYGSNFYFTFKDKNAKNEDVKVELSICENPGGKNSLPEIWKKKGYTNKVLQSWWGVTVYVTDSENNCRGDYNPQSKWDGKRNIIDFDFMLDATQENADRIINEIRKRAFSLPCVPETIEIKGEEIEKTECTKVNEAHPLDNISLTETDNFNGVRYFDIEGAGIITSAKVRADIQPGDVFNVYTNEERKFGVTYDGVSVESSLKNDLPGIIEFNDKIESGTLSASSHYTPLAEGVEFYEKKVKGKRYTVKDNPLTLGYYGILDNLDNCIIDCYQTKEEAEKEAEILNGFTDGNERLKSVI